jgi:hypothetical protein
MGNLPLASNASLTEIREFLDHRGTKSIKDISKWDDNGFWSDWQFGNVPNHLLQQLEMLRVELREATPVHKTEKDNWGWRSTGTYSAAKGYALLQLQKDIPHPTRFWMEVWDSMAIPKVNFFFWTDKNLMKRNIVGPHRCSLCKEATETSDHLFVDCHFANKFWILILHVLNVTAPNNISVVDLFINWKECYPSFSLN